MIFSALVLCGAGFLWQTNDFVQAHREHPFFSPQAEISQMRYDVYGDPYAIAKPAPLAYDMLWSNPVSRLAIVFVLFLVIGSLIRSLLGGLFALLFMLAVLVMLASQGTAVDFLLNRPDAGFFENLVRWFQVNAGGIKERIGAALPSTIAAGLGLGMGLFR